MYCYRVIISSPRAAPGQLMQWPVIRRPSVVSFHIFDNSSRTISWIEKKLSRRHCGDLELLKSFRSDIQDGRQGDHLEMLQTTSPPKPCPIELKLDGRHHNKQDYERPD